MNLRPHLVLFGGFLGAGKTTAAVEFARFLRAQGIRAGLIANDQGDGLVDGTVMRASGHATAEVPAGCFCCRFDDFVGRLQGGCFHEPMDIFIAEAVGSCTDLAATVVRPLRRLHGEQLTVAPLSVLVDPERARRLLAESDWADFSEDVRYVFGKQLEEADLIVVTKADSTAPTEHTDICVGLAERFPEAEVLAISARNGGGLAAWFDRLLFGEARDRAAVDVDYDRYAAGEAKLGWLNAAVRVTAANRFDPDSWLLNLVNDLRGHLQREGARVAHLKLSVETGESTRSVGSVNWVRDDTVPVAGMRVGHSVTDCALLINLRAEAAPGMLQDAVMAVLGARPGKPGEPQVEIGSLTAFRPGRPQPTHRDSLLSSRLPHHVLPAPLLP